MGKGQGEMVMWMTLDWAHKIKGLSLNYDYVGWWDQGGGGRNWN